MSTMSNDEKLQRILPILEEHIKIPQWAFGHLITGTRNIINHQNPRIRQMLEDDVIKTIQGLMVVYLFALWEEYISKDDEREYLKENELKRLLAFRHIRHSVAHNFDGGRANGCRNQFEEIMNGDDPFQRVDYTEEKINLTNSQVAMDCYKFMKHSAEQIVLRIANPPLS